MKFFITFLIFAFSISAQAQLLKQIDIKAPFVTAPCVSAEIGQMGALGLVTSSITFEENESEITLTATHELFVCRISEDGNQVFNWEKVNPFSGFEVQYFDSQTDSLKRRKVWIDPSKAFNGLKIVAVLNPLNPEEKFATTKLTETENDSFSGALVLKKSDLLSESDLAKIEAGEVVRKKIEIYQVSNFTTFIGNEEIRLGDETQSGRNIFLVFQK